MLSLKQIWKFISSNSKVLSAPVGAGGGMSSPAFPGLMSFLLSYADSIHVWKMELIEVGNKNS